MSEIEEKIAEIINKVHSNGYSDILVDEEAIAKEITSLTQIEVDCPECGGEGGFQFSVNPDDCKLCSTCNGNKSITKTPESGDRGR